MFCICYITKLVITKLVTIFLFWELFSVLYLHVKIASSRFIPLCNWVNTMIWHKEIIRRLKTHFSIFFLSCKVILWKMQFLWVLKWTRKSLLHMLDIPQIWKWGEGIGKTFQAPFPGLDKSVLLEGMISSKPYRIIHITK